MRPVLPKVVLDEIGDLPYEIRTGSRHYHLYVGGVFVGVFSKGGRGWEDRGRDTVAMKSNVRRAIRQHRLGRSK